MSSNQNDKLARKHTKSKSEKEKRGEKGFKKEKFYFKRSEKEKNLLEFWSFKQHI